MNRCIIRLLSIMIVSVLVLTFAGCKANNENDLSGAEETTGNTEETKGTTIADESDSQQPEASILKEKTISGSGGVTTYAYSYDDSGRLTELLYYHNHELQSRETYEYTTSENTVLIRFYDAENQFDYDATAYFENDKLICFESSAEKVVNGENLGNFEYTLKYEYDGAGRLICVEYEDSNQKKGAIRLQYESYDLPARYHYEYSDGWKFTSGVICRPDGTFAYGGSENARCEYLFDDEKIVEANLYENDVAIVKANYTYYANGDMKTSHIYKTTDNWDEFDEYAGYEYVYENVGLTEADYQRYEKMQDMHEQLEARYYFFYVLMP